MKALFCLLLMTGLLLAACSKSSGPSATNSTNAYQPGSNPLNAPADYVGALAAGKAKAIKTVDIASLNQAIQMFNVQEGRFPKDLNELIEKQLIIKVPDAPYGMKLVYDANAGVVTVVKKDQ